MKTIDFYTTVIDNYGDAGFAFHLAISLMKERPDIKIRFFLDDEKLFLKLKGDNDFQNITYYDLSEIKNGKPSHIIFNFFDRKIDFEYLHSFSHSIKLINFSYFLMHSGVKSLHNTSYTSKNVSVTHYIPSLLPEGGGVIINPYIYDYKKSINKNWISVFCYKETFENIKEVILEDKENTYFIFDNYLEGNNIVNMPFINILDYYKFLSLCEKNIVRGENSFINSLLTGKPFLWDIYKEHNGAHKEKIEDFSNYFVSYFGESFLEYNEILREFNIGNIQEGFRNFLNYQNDFDKIYRNISEEQNLVRSVDRIMRNDYIQ